MIIIHTDIQKKISHRLSLPYDDFMQDWDVEVANPERLMEFIDFLKKTSLSKEEKYAVMALIIASFDESLSKENPECRKVWESIKELILQDKQLYADHINYWSLKEEGDNPEHLFKVTPFIREIY